MYWWNLGNSNEMEMFVINEIRTNSSVILNYTEQQMHEDESKNKNNASESGFTMNDFLAIFFMIGLIVIYIPQYYKIYKNKSSYGFSPWFVFMGYCGAFLSWINGGIYYIDNWRECHGSVNCTQHLTGIFLIIFQWILFLIMYVMYVYYYKNIQVYEIASERSRLLSNNSDSSSDIINYQNLLEGPNPTEEIASAIINNETSLSPKQCCKKTAILFSNETKASILTYFILSQLIGAISIGITIGLVAQDNWAGENLHNTLEWSQFLSTITSLMFCLHYLPQIYKTISLGKVGSLSLVTLGIMCPGTFVWTYFLATQNSVVGNSPNSGSPSVWVPFLVVGVLQGVLLVVGSYCERQQRKIAQYLLDLEESCDIQA